MRSVQLLLTVSLILTSLSLYSHHSPFIFFDAKRSVEVEGTLTYVKWGNPHPKFKIEARDEKGNAVIWNIEANSHSILRRMDLKPDVIGVGDKVKAAGWPAVRGKHAMFVTNMLLAEGTEIVFFPGVPPRYSETILGDSKTWLVTEENLQTPSNNEAGIFHVWSTSLGDVSKALLFDGVEFPLTEAAAKERAAYDLFDNPILGQCEFKGMPIIMEQPYPMELVDAGNKILFKMEEGDTLRTIYMDEADLPEERPPVPLGYSTGKWEGNVLVVSTSGSSWPKLDNTGVPQSASASYVERFTPSENGKRLDYAITITDGNTLTEPITLTKHWFWIPDAVVHPYACDE